ncbi:MAG TPA: transglycosylase domain-containing protein [Candidatus Woesebacteria bacterium]|nr:transglycosylase domain-containing protein [Candidatus Woesebacteria bacterium]
MKKRKKTPKKITPTISWIKAHLKIVILIVLLVFAALFYFFILRDLPSPKTIATQTPYSTQIYDRHGKLLYEIYAEENRLPVKLEELPDYVVKATIAIEDRNFYQHHGFSTKGILRAAYKTIFQGNLQGGSTLTQQLVKNALLTQERTLKRKIKEAILTVLTEIIYNKDQILTMYFEQTPYGGTAWGIEAAAKRYFNKPAKQLTLAEAALLAGLPASPTTFSPFGAHPELAKSRQELVLNEMVEAGFISQEEAQKAKEEKLVFAPLGEEIFAPHFVMYVKEALVELFGQKMVEEGGLQVTTTLDRELQDFAQKTVKEEIEKIKKLKVENGGALITNPKTGEILAMVGSRDYFDKEIDGNFNVTTAALRQPGSSIKPLNYVLALEEGKITASTPLIDAPTCFSVAGQKPYCPTNYDYSYHGITQTRFALGNSYNIPAVKVLALNGLENFLNFCKKLGITTFGDPKNYGLSLTLGGGEVRMTEMATAFGALANLGVKKPLVSILKVTDQHGKILLENEETLGQIGERVISPEASYIVTHILLDNNARSAAFGSHSQLVVEGHPEVAVKTGTTNEKKDNWTIGYTPSRLVAVWVGNNDGSSMGAVASGVTGASPIWNKLISFALDKDNLGQEWPVKPEGVVGYSVCSDSGQLPKDSGCPTRFEYFIKDKPPKQTASREKILVNKDTGEPLLPWQKEENAEEQEHPIVRDPLGAIFCLDCPPPSKAAVFNYPLKKGN